MNTLSKILTSSILLTAPFLLAAPLSLQTSEAQNSKPFTLKPGGIRILLQEGKEKAIIEVKGRYNVYDSTTGLLITSGMFSKLEPVSTTENGLVWGDLFPGVFQMRILPGDSQASILVNGKQYQGAIDIYDVQGDLKIINEIDAENYLRSTLTFQVEENLSSEVLNAIAIVARTNAYATTSKMPHALWHIKADDVHYDGYGLTMQNMAIEDAIAATKHVILTYQGAPFSAVWTENSAGKTANFSTMFRKKGNFPNGVTSPVSSKDRTQHSWAFSISKQELAEIAHVQKVAKLDMFADKESGKVYAIKVSDGNKETKDIDFFALQKALGKNKLKSSDFSIKVEGDKIVFQGFGEGIGVGLCLYSAQRMAEKGEHAAKILTTFFPETKIERLKTNSSANNKQSSSGQYLK